jgi:hypothetical protein
MEIPLPNGVAEAVNVAASKLYMMPEEFVRQITIAATEELGVHVADFVNKAA